MTDHLHPLHTQPTNVRPPFYGRPTGDPRAALIEAIGPDVELGAYDHRIIAWLANWDTSTVGTVVSLLHRVRAAGESRATNETTREA